MSLTVDRTMANGLPRTGFGTPQRGVRLEDCTFYHHMTFPDGEKHSGHWDLRSCVNDYLGNLDFAGKTVIEIGPASGFLTFEMEARGAEVTAVELSQDYLGDVVPVPKRDPAAELRHRETIVTRTINSFWYGHERTHSKASVYYGDARTLPADFGSFNIGILGAVMLHSRDQAGMLISCASRVTDSIVIVDGWHEWMTTETQPTLRLAPTANGNNNHTWWQISPKYLEQLLGSLGFKAAAVYRFEATHMETKPYQLYAMVAHRHIP